MRTIDWGERVDLHRREHVEMDAALEIFPMASGTLGDMIDYVFLLPPGKRARVWIEGRSIGLLSIFEIIVLSMRADFPARHLHAAAGNLEWQSK